MDKFDKDILKLLQQDASLPLAELAELVSLSKTACWRRLQKLQANGVITARICLLDAKKLNLSLTVFISVRTNRHDRDWLDNFAEVVTALPEIQEIYRMSGDLDYLLRATVTDMAGYDALYKKLIRNVSLYDISASFVMETIKRTTQLPLTYMD